MFCRLTILCLLDRTADTTEVTDGCEYFFLRAACWPALIRVCLIIFADDLMPGIVMTFFNCISMVKCYGDSINDKLEGLQNEAVIYFHVSLPLSPVPQDKTHGFHNSVIYFCENNMSKAVHHFRMWYFVIINYH